MILFVSLMLIFYFAAAKIVNIYEKKAGLSNFFMNPAVF